MRTQGKDLLAVFESLPDTPRLDPDTEWQDAAVEDYLDRLAAWAYQKGLADFFKAMEWKPVCEECAVGECGHTERSLCTSFNEPKTFKDIKKLVWEKMSPLEREVFEIYENLPYYHSPYLVLEHKEQRELEKQSD